MIYAIIYIIIAMFLVGTLHLAKEMTAGMNTIKIDNIKLVRLSLFWLPLAIIYFIAGIIFFEYLCWKYLFLIIAEDIDEYRIVKYTKSVFAKFNKKLRV